MGAQPKLRGLASVRDGALEFAGRDHSDCEDRGANTSYRAAILAVCWTGPGKPHSILPSPDVLPSLIPKPATQRAMQTIDWPSLMNTDKLASYRLGPAMVKVACPRTTRSSRFGLFR